MDYEKLSNEQLVVLARSGDCVATNQLIARFELAIQLKVNKFSSHHWIRDDLMQRGRLAVNKAINKYDLNHESKSQFSTYVNTCIENEIKSAIIEINKNNNVDLIDIIESDKNAFIVDDRFDPEKIAIDNETEQELKAVSIEILSNIEQNVYSLKNLGYKNGDISKELKIDKKSVENALTRIKQKFYKKLKANDNK